MSNPSEQLAEGMSVNQPGHRCFVAVDPRVVLLSKLLAVISEVLDSGSEALLAVANCFKYRMVSFCSLC